MSALLPCPFCGSARLRVVDRRYLVGFPFDRGNEAPERVVLCENCDARGPWNRLRSGAEAAWNTRPVAPVGAA